MFSSLPLYISDVGLFVSDGVSGTLSGVKPYHGLLIKQPCKESHTTHKGIYIYVT